MANAAGGTILYGAVEGEGEEAALIVGFEAMALEPDAVDLQVSSLLRDGVEERLPHVLHKAIPLPGGGYLYAIRVSPSSRAPHRVTVRSKRERFFVRGNVSNEPMRIEQIREAFLRSNTMVERARHVLGERTSATLQYIAQLPPSERPTASKKTAALLHVIPLDQSLVAPDLADQTIADRMKTVRGYNAGYPGNVRWALEGIYNLTEITPHRRAWALFSRDGVLEFGKLDALGLAGPVDNRTIPVLDIWYLDQDIRICIEQVRDFAAAGHLATPFLLSFQLLNVGGSFLVNTQGFTDEIGHRFEGSHIAVAPQVVTDWNAGLDVAVRRIYDTVWQAYGNQRCLLFNVDGTRTDRET